MTQDTARGGGGSNRATGNIRYRPGGMARRLILETSAETTGAATVIATPLQKAPPWQ